MKILVIGTGSIGERHISNLSKLGVKDLAILTREGGKKGRKFDISNIPQYQTSMDAYNSFRPTHIVICTPSSNHFNEISFWGEKVERILVEIPLVTSMLEYRSIPASVIPKIYLGFNLRFHPIYKKLRQLLLMSGDKILRIRAQFGESILDQHGWDAVYERYEVNASLGGGALLTSCHEIDLACDLLGSPINTIGMACNLALEIDCEDSAFAISKHEHGGISEIHLNLWQPSYERDFTVSTLNHTYKWEFLLNRLDVYSRRDSIKESYSANNFDFNETYVDEIKDFLTSETPECADYASFSRVMTIIEQTKGIESK